MEIEEIGCSRKLLPEVCGGLLVGFAKSDRTRCWRPCSISSFGGVRAGGEHESLQRDGGSKQSHQMEVPMRVVPSWNVSAAKLAYECAGDEDWIEKRKRSSNRMDMRDFVIFAMTNVIHSVVHRSTIWRMSQSRQGNWAA